ncbi:MAG: endonuclease/exonuclease/phosphatase family protein [Shimia sp.]
MRLVCLNAWGGREWPVIEDWLPTCGADILCLQEVTRSPVASPEWLWYRDPPRRVLKQRADLFGDIAYALPDHVGQFQPAMRGVLEETDGTEVASEHGNALFLHQRLALTHQRQDFVTGRFRQGFLPQPGPRPVQIARIEHGGWGLWVVHLHGLYDTQGKHDTPARAAQAQRLVRLVQETWDRHEPLILCGDLNVLGNSQTLTEIGRMGLVNLNAAHGVTDTRTALYEKDQREADWCFATPGLSVRAFEAPAEPVLSDHRPLILDFDL